MAVTLLKTAGAISLVIFSLLMILTAFASRDASYAMIDGDIRQSLTFNAERAGYAKAALAVLVFSLSLFLLGYAAGQGQKKCPRCDSLVMGHFFIQLITCEPVVANESYKSRKGGRSRRSVNPGIVDSQTFIFGVPLSSCNRVLPPFQSNSCYECYLLFIVFE